jgi:hypothetical protein
LINCGYSSGEVRASTVGRDVGPITHQRIDNARNAVARIPSRDMAGRPKGTWARIGPGMSDISIIVITIIKGRREKDFQRSPCQP